MFKIIMTVAGWFLNLFIWKSGSEELGYSLQPS
jgi:glutathione peroxidase